MIPGYVGYIFNVFKSPIFEHIRDDTIDERESLTLIITAIDPDGGDLSYSALSLSLAASFDLSTQMLSWTPSAVMFMKRALSYSCWPLWQ